MDQILKKSENAELVTKAFEFAREAHQGQKRKSGEDFVTHPLAVARIIQDWGLDATTVAAGLLHDVADDTKRTLADIEKGFGPETAFLVEGVSKLGHLRLPKKDLRIRSIAARAAEPIDLEAENLRKMFFAMAQDIRVVLIKLADRLHNMRTLGALPPPKQQRIALETLEIFAPLANRLGMGEIKGQLEDLAFLYLYPKEYEWLLQKTEARYEERKKYLERVKRVLIELLRKENINFLDIHSRTKHYWSLYQKLLSRDMNLDKIHDLVALRVIVANIEDCYRVLGLIHKHWRPLPGFIKDYIALPKPNTYKSLHTTCFGPDGKLAEIQIKTKEMHEGAEYGIAAHWAYKEGLDVGLGGNQFAWVRQLMAWQKQEPGSKEFLERLKIDFFKNRIFVLTPKGEVIDLPEGATPVDFAYAIHSDIGDRCDGAMAEGKLIPLNSELKNGQVVEIITAKNKKPSRDWLEYVKTSAARSKIREWLRKKSADENMRNGTELLNKEFGQIHGISFSGLPQRRQENLIKSFGLKDFASLARAVGGGEMSARDVSKALLKEESSPSRQEVKINYRPVFGKTSSVSLAGKTGMLVNIAKCCLPQPGDKISGYITRSRGATAHGASCKNFILAQQKWPLKIIEAAWIADTKTPQIIAMHLTIEDRLGILRDITSAVSEAGVNITSCATGPRPTGRHYVNLKVEISDAKQLERMFEGLKGVIGVIEAKRV